MTILSQTSMLAALITISIAVSLLLGRHSRLRNHFAYFNINLALCLSAIFVVSLGDEVGQLGLRLLLIFSLGLPVTGLRFFALFLPDLEKWISRTLNLCYPLTVTLGGIIVTPLYNHSVFLLLHAIYVLCVFTLCFVYLVIRYHSSHSPGERSRLRAIFTGGFITIVLAVLDLTSYNLNWTYVFLANIGMAIYMYYLLQLIQTARALEFSELFGKGAVLGVLSFLIAGIYWLMTFWVGTQQLGPFFVSVLVASIVILILYEPLRDAVESRAAQYLFAQQRELRLLLEQLRRDLVNVIDLEKMTKLLMVTLQRSKRATHAAFYLLSEDTSGYKRVSYFGDAPAQNIDLVRHGSFINQLQDVLSPMVRQDIEFQFTSSLFSFKQEGEGIHREERLLEIIRTLDQLNADVCFPCISSGKEVMGFICLKDERFDNSYMQEELSFMMMVAAQAAITIENSRLFDKIKENTRLAALGEMAAGLAHEIRNPLGAIKGAAQLLRPDRLEESEQEWIEIILEEVDRLNGVVCQFLDYARPLRSHLELTDLNQLLRRTLQLLETEAPVQGITIRPDLDEDLPLIYADAEQLKQVFLNLIRNSIEAMPEGGQLRISSRLQGQTELSPYVELIVEDEGEGISAEVQKNIFMPFYTTKEKGTGLGLSISQRLIEHHEGSIHIQSRLQEGTKFIIRLPLQPSNPQRHTPAIV